MGFRLSITIPETGVVINHWDHISINWDNATGKVHMMFGGWVNKAARLAGKSPVIVRGIEAPQADFNLGGIKNISIGKFKALPEFAGSVDE